MEAARATLEQGERALRDEREQVNSAERELREAEFAQRECRNKLQELAGNRVLAQQQLERLVGELARCEESAAAMHAEDLEPRLQEALDHRVAHEHALAYARDALENAANGLRALDEQRLKVEQSLDPLRDRIGELKLKEQAASSPCEQFAARNWRRSQCRRTVAAGRTRRCTPGQSAECDCRAATLDRSARCGQPGGPRRTRSGA
jgi:chromosome segregation protein